MQQKHSFVLAAGNQPISCNTGYMNAWAGRYHALTDQPNPGGLEGYTSTSAALSELDRHQDSIPAQAAGLRHLTGLTPWLEYYLFRAPVR